MKSLSLTIAICLMAILSFAQAPAPDATKPPVDTTAVKEALQIIQVTWTVLGQSVTPLKVDEGGNLKTNLEKVYHLLESLLPSKQPADKPKVEPAKK